MQFAADLPTGKIGAASMTVMSRGRSSMNESGRKAELCKPLGVSMKETVSEIKDGKAYFRFTREFYGKEAVLNASYKMTDKYSAMIKSVGDHEILVTLEPKTQQSRDEIESAASDFCNELLDQQLRLDLEKRFGKIWELIVEHAFSPLADLKSRFEQIK